MSYISEAQAKKMICDASRSIRLCTAVTVNGTSLTKDKTIYDLITALNGLSGGTGTFTQLTGPITSAVNGGATSITNGAVTDAKLENVPTSTVKGRVAAGTGVPTNLTTTQLTTLVNTFTATEKGAVSPPTTATGRFLRDDNTWQAVLGGGSSTTYATTVTGSAGITCFITGSAGITVAKTNASTITFTIPSGGILDSWQISYPSGENPGAVPVVYIFNYTNNTVTNQGNSTANPPNVNGWFTSGVPTDVYISSAIGNSSTFVRTITTVGGGNITMTFTFGSTGLSTGAIALKGWF